MPIVHPQLSAIARQTLPGSRIESLSLANGTGIRLYLLNRDFPRGPLAPEAVRVLMERPSYWSFCWASGVAMSAFLLLERADWVRGKRVVDFGCGSGVVAISAALAGAAEVIACDSDPHALLATAENAALNGVTLTLNDRFDDIDGEVDLILAADVLYDRDNLCWLARFVQRATAVLVADSRVRNFNYPRYRQIAGREASTLPDLDESAEFRRVRIYRA
jgi:predicted nicotinamide N-methyase